MNIGFIGLGLIGGSIAKTIRRVHPDVKIIAYNRSASVLNDALVDGTIDEACWEISGAFAACDYVFMCTPVVTMIRQMKMLKPYLKFGAVLTDVGSTKGVIHRAVHELGLDDCFIGGHPMAGSEKTGYENATDRMIENAWYILTPGEDVAIERLSAFSEFIASLGALPLIINPDEHDFVTAAISHVPHVVSASLVNMVKDLDGPEEYMRTIAAGGFKDITRISSSSPQMWEEICLSNSENICIVLDRFIRKLTDFRFAIRNENSERLLKYFTECRDYRETFSDEAPGPIKRSWRLYMDIIDEAGAIAEVATVLAEANISIKNIGIVHNRTFEKGVLRVEFYDEAACTSAIDVLRNNHYRVYED